MALEELSPRNIIGTFYKQLKEETGKLWVPRIAMDFTSNQDSETYKWLGMTSRVREWVGGRLAKSLSTNGLTITNKRWENTLLFSNQDLRRDKTGQIKIRIGDLAKRAAEHPAYLLSLFIVEGDSNTYGTCYDDQNFFSASHSEGSSGTQTNLLTSADFSELTVNIATNPTAYEMQNIILKLVQKMYSYKDDQGEPLDADSVGTDNFILMVPINMWAAAKAATGQLNLDTGSGTVDNIAKGLTVDAIPNPRLTDDTVIYLFKATGSVAPFIKQTEVPVQTQWIGPDSEFSFDNYAQKMGIWMSYNVGYGYWQYAIRATLST